MNPYRAAQGTGPDWFEACDVCLRQLTDLPSGAYLGFVYASDPLAGSLDLIVRRLTEATGIGDWIGAGGAAVCANGQEYHDHGAIVVLAVPLPARSYQIFDDLADGAGPLPGDEPAGRTGDGRIGFGVVHGDPRQARLPQAIAELCSASDAFLVGGLTSARESWLQMAGRPTEGSLSGVLIDADIPILTGISQGCSPIGPTHEVTACQGPWVRSLDGRPALEVLKEEAGEVLARNLDRVGGFIHVATPVSGSDRADYVVRNLVGIDPIHRSIAVGDEVRRGDQLLFVKRDGSTAQADLRRMLDDLVRRTEGRPIKGALYHSCVARGPHMFGPDSAELKMIEAALGPVPLAGFFTNGEIFRNRLYGYTGVLTLFL